MTLNELKEKLNSLTDEQLKQKIIVDVMEEIRTIESFYFVEENMYCNFEQCGYNDELCSEQDAIQNDCDIDKCSLVLEKGDFVLYNE